MQIHSNPHARNSSVWERTRCLVWKTGDGRHINQRRREEAVKEEGERNVLKYYIKEKRFKMKRLEESKWIQWGGKHCARVCLFESVFGKPEMNLNWPWSDLKNKKTKILLELFFLTGEIKGIVCLRTFMLYTWDVLIKGRWRHVDKTLQQHCDPSRALYSRCFSLGCQLVLISIQYQNTADGTYFPDLFCTVAF